jgi:protein phosphatase
MEAVALSDIGLVRSENQDSFLVCSEKGLFVVADGMGGHQGGALASDVAVSCLREFADSREDLTPGEVARAVERANHVIYQLNLELSASPYMGTTLTAGLIFRGFLYLAHVGDSRVYLFRQGKLELLTRDHSVVGELVRQGQLTPGEALNHPQRSLLIKALGVEADVEIDLSQVPLMEGDLLLFCSDGLSNTVPEEEIGLLLAEGHSLEDTANHLVARSYQSGAQDNITLIMVRYRTLVDGEVTP